MALQTRQKAQPGRLALGKPRGVRRELAWPARWPQRASAARRKQRSPQLTPQCRRPVMLVLALPQRSNRSRRSLGEKERPPQRKPKQGHAISECGTDANTAGYRCNSFIKTAATSDERSHAQVRRWLGTRRRCWSRKKSWHTFSREVHDGKHRLSAHILSCHGEGRYGYVMVQK